MMKKTFALAAAASLLATPAWPAAGCAGPGDELAMKTSAMQQALMVAALSCRDVEQYNRFVIWHRHDLQKSDAELLRFFERENGAAAGEADYHAFKTKAANMSALEAARDSTAYCANAARLFQAAFEPEGANLAWFVSSQWPATGELIHARCTVAGARDAMSEGVSRLFESPVPASPEDPPSAERN